ncbi:HK97 family phage prohead protease [Paraferrimonas haliotis]|uniref:Prohead serine protease domain-containing protein n=1 Tax=Paraferrimonas haliotis TaxID=2013866 RepID=A0AA37TPG2_9GAMM|nr:HK97 family phage prohead protease [Paraferrimonas haliotis]GLS83228.1 hypothetical protein GCM10007894_12050 [Paraferrimonas haliotis]
MKNVNRMGFSHQVRMEGEGEERKIVGYAAKFNTRSNNLGGFVEVIEEGAFDGVLDDDVRALFNHSPLYVLGRNSAGTLSLFIDEIGLRYEITPPDTQTINDLVIAPMERGDIDQSSFAFRLPSDGYRWDEADDGVYVRTITRISKLLDVSPVTYPAYNDTEAAARSLEAYKRSQVENHNDAELRMLQEQSHRDRQLQTL